MPPRTLLVLAVVLLAATAGCSLFDPEPQGAPDAGGEGPDPAFPPGLTADGVTDRTALASAHHEALENESYRMEHRLTIRNESGAIQSVHDRRQTVTDDATEVLLETDPGFADAGPNGVVTAHVWTDGDVAYTREVSESGDATYYPAAHYTASEPGLPVSMLTLYEAVDDVSVERDGYRLEGSDTGPSGDTLSFELRLAEAGYVAEYRAVSRVSGGDGGRSLEYVGSFERDDDRRYFERNHVGYYEERTTIDLAEPDWLEEAADATENRRLEATGEAAGGR